MTKEIIEHCKKGVLLGVVFVLNVFFANSANAYQVNGGNFLKIIQSGGHTGSNSFRVKAHLQPIARPSAGPVDAVVVVTPPGSPAVITTPEVAVRKQSDDGSEKYDSSGWSLARKYNELAAVRDEKLRASAPKEVNDFVPTALADVELVDRYEKLSVEDFVESPKNQSDTLELDPSLKPNKPTQVTKPKKEMEASFHALSPKTDVRTDIETDIPFIERPLITSEEIITSSIGKKSETSCIRYPYIDSNPWEPLAYLLFCALIGFFSVILLLILLIIWMCYQQREAAYEVITKNKKKKKRIRLKSWFSVLVLIGLFGANGIAATTTTPQKIIYEGELLDTGANPVTGSYDFRFSLWDNQDYELVDTIAGEINPVVSDFLGWQEIQTQNIVNYGKFSFQIGTVTPFSYALFDRIDMSLQVEVKPTGSPNTSYELIDLDTLDTTIDRMVIDSVPYAFNADKLDFRETGFAVGEIPYQDVTGKLPNSIIPDIDAVLLDGRDTGYNPGNIPFIDSVTGLLPSTILPSGGGSTSANIPGTNTNIFTIDLDNTAVATDNLVLQFGNALNETIMWNGVNQQFEISDDLNINGNLTVSGTLNGVSVGIRTRDDRMSPRYPNSILEGDGTDNKDGYMYEEEESVLGVVKSILRWTTSNANLQDYDVIIRYPVAENFKSFKTPALSLEYLTELTATNTKIDLTVNKEGVVGDQLSGTGLGLTSNTWVNQNFGLTGGTTWAVGDVMVIRLKMYATNNSNAKVGDIVIHSLVD